MLEMYGRFGCAGRPRRSIDGDVMEKPTTISQAVDMLVSLTPEDDKEHIRSNPDHSMSHFFAGRIIRNSWGLWDKKSPIVQEALLTYGISHADDVSGLLFKWAFAKIRGEEFDPYELAKRYKDHWKKLAEGKEL